MFASRIAFVALPGVRRGPIGPLGAMFLLVLLCAPLSPVSALDGVPEGAVRESVHRIDLEAGQAFEFDVPLWNGGTQVTVAFAPSGATLQGAQRRLSQVRQPRSLAAVERDLGAAVSRQATERSAFRFELRVGGQVRSADPRFSGLRTFHVSVGMLPKGAATRARGILRNVSGRTQSGEIRIQSVDAAAMSRLTAERQRAELRELVRQSDPDLVFAVGHTLQRHVAGYPGGRSEFEAELSHRLTDSGVSAAFLRTVSQSLRPLQAEVQARIRNPRLRGLSPQQAVDLPTATAIREARPLQREPLQLEVRPEVQLLDLPVDRPPQESLQLFRIFLAAIQSHRCADDAGWEWGCDEEEPYVVWSMDSPEFMRRGATDKAPNMVRGSERFLTGETNVFSATEASPEHRRPSSPLLFLYQVIESDPGGPSSSDLEDALGAGVATALAFFAGSLEALIATGLETLRQVAELLMKAAAKGDDLYPILIAAFDGERLLSLTSGDSVGPLDANLFDSAGSYDKWAVRVPVVYQGGQAQWSLVYIISRQEAPPPDVAIGSLYSLQALMGDSYVRHRSFRGEVTAVGSTLDRRDATFRIVPGLANVDWISFESLNYPGHYLRHQNFEFHLHPESADQLFREDATFRIRPGLQHPDLVTFESYNYPGHFIYWTADDRKLRLGDFFYNQPEAMKYQPAVQAVWRTMATFRIVDPLTRQ